MPRIEVDPKRTGVKASRIEWTEPPMFLDGHLWYGPIGAMIHREGADDFGVGFLICCPGCGQLGGARQGHKWTVSGGSATDVTTLSLTPSIQKHCCGWHGYLRHGVFESC
jgi:hypothetical protein